MPAEHRDLAEVVHDPDARKAGFLGRGGDGTQPRAGLHRTSGPREHRQLQPEAQADRCGGLRSGEPHSRATRAGAVRTTAGSSTVSNSPVERRRVGFRARAPGAPAPDRGRPCRAPDCGRGTPSPASRTRLRRVATSCRPARSSHAARRSGSSPSVSTTVVNRRRSRCVTMVSSSANASVLAARSSSPSPTTARRRSLDTICSGAKWLAAHDDFPDPDGPTRTTKQGAGSTTASASSVASGTPHSSSRAPSRLPPDNLSSASKTPRQARTSGL